MKYLRIFLCTYIVWGKSDIRDVDAKCPLKYLEMGWNIILEHNVKEKGSQYWKLKSRNNFFIKPYCMDKQKADYYCIKSQKKRYWQLSLFATKLKGEIFFLLGFGQFPGGGTRD